MNRACIVVVIWWALALPVGAQSIDGARVGFGGSVPAVGPAQAKNLDSIPTHRSMWFEGGVVTGSFTAAIATIVALDRNQYGDRHLGPITAVPVVLLSGLMGFAPGALAGSIFPKPHPEGTQSRGKQWRKSAIIGGVAGVVTMNLLFSAIGADASVEPRLKLSLIGGGSGFLWGAFMGLLQPAIADNPETVK